MLFNIFLNIFICALSMSAQGKSQNSTDLGKYTLWVFNILSRSLSFSSISIHFIIVNSLTKKPHAARLCFIFISLLFYYHFIRFKLVIYISHCLTYHQLPTLFIMLTAVPILPNRTFFSNPGNIISSHILGFILPIINEHYKPGD